MNLIKTQTHNLTDNTKVACVKCGNFVPLHLTMADTEGKPYKDYYCLPCAKAMGDKLK